MCMNNFQRGVNFEITDSIIQISGAGTQIVLSDFDII